MISRCTTSSTRGRGRGGVGVGGAMKKKCLPNPNAGETKQRVNY